MMLKQSQILLHGFEHDEGFFLFKKTYCVVFHVCVCVHACVCVYVPECIPYVYMAFKSQKRMSDNLELELQVVGRCVLETKLGSPGSTLYAFNH